MKKTILFRAAALLCAALCVSVYALCLYKISLSGMFLIPKGNNMCHAYIADICCLTVMALFLSAVFGLRDKRLYIPALLLAVLLTAGYCTIMDYMSQDIFMKLYMLKVSLWPFITYFIVLAIKRITDKKGLCVFLAGIVIYYIIAAFAAGVEFYRPAEPGYSLYEPLERVYMLFISVFAWVVMNKDRFFFSKACRYKYKPNSSSERVWDFAAILLNILCISAVICIILFSTARTYDILQSLKNPIVNTDGNTADVNWIGYRIALLLNAWRGNLYVAEKPFVFNIAYGCSLFQIKYTYGKYFAILVLLAEILMLCCIGAAALNKKGGEKLSCLSCVILVSIITRGVVGIMAEIFMLISTDMGAMLLRNPGDVFIILYFIFSRFKKCSDESCKADAV